MVDATITIEMVLDQPEFATYLEDQLLDSLRAQLPQALNTRIVLTARDAHRNIIGGLDSSTAYSWLHIHVLWVHESHRGAGVGTALMNRAEAMGSDRNCRGAWLDTSSPQAMAFYQRLGYESFGHLANTTDQVPASHQRWFMSKTW